MSTRRGRPIREVQDAVARLAPDGGTAGDAVNGGSRDVIGNLFAGGTLGAIVGLVTLPFAWAWQRIRR